MEESHTSSNRFSVYEAAEIMDITVDAIRKRVARGTIPHEKAEDGRVWVLLDTDQGTASKIRDTDQPQSDRDALISEMRERVASLERQLETEQQAHAEARRLLMAALERIPPQLEAPSEARESPQPAKEEPDRAESQPATVESQEPLHRPWWRRVFGGG
jgi:hypothetical protein